MKSAARSLSISSSIVFYLSGAKLLFFCLTDLNFGSIFNRWVITSGEILGMLVADQAKTSAFLLNRSSSCFRTDSGRSDPIWTIFIGLIFLNVIETSHSTGSPLSLLSLWSSLSTDKRSLELLPSIETMKQYRASCWSLRISLIPFFVENQTRRWYIETTALNTLSPGHPSIAL